MDTEKKEKYSQDKQYVQEDIIENDNFDSTPLDNSITNDEEQNQNFDRDYEHLQNNLDHPQEEDLNNNDFDKDDFDKENSDEDFEEEENDLEDEDSDDEDSDDEDSEDENSDNDVEKDVFNHEDLDNLDPLKPGTF